MSTPDLIAACILGLPMLWILVPRVYQLCVVRNGRSLEELLFAFGVLTAPCLMILEFQRRLAFERTGLAQASDASWLALGLAVGVPLWGTKKLLMLFFEEVLTFLGRVGRWPWAGEEGWGRPLEGVCVLGLLWCVSLLFIPLVVSVINLLIEPCRR